MGRGGARPASPQGGPGGSDASLRREEGAPLIVWSLARPQGLGPGAWDAGGLGPQGRIATRRRAATSWMKDCPTEARWAASCRLQTRRVKTAGRGGEPEPRPRPKRCPSLVSARQLAPRDMGRPDLELCVHSWIFGRLRFSHAWIAMLLDTNQWLRISADEVEPSDM